MATSLAALVNERSRQHVGVSPPPKGPPVILDIPHPARPQWLRIAAIALPVGSPLALWWFPPPNGLSPQGWHVALILLGAALAWFLEPVPDFVIALAMSAAWGITGLVPLARAFAGFTSASYVVALGALGLAAAMVRSGLLFRISLLLLKTFPATYLGQVLALLAGGILVTPLVPLGIARVAAVAPLAQELAQGLGYPPRSRGSAGLAFAGLLGYGAFSSIFLTGLVMNFYVYGLLGSPDRSRFGWFPWFISAAPTGVVLLIGAILVLAILFRPGIPAKTTREVLRRQKSVLGPLSRHESVTIAGLSLFLLGLVLQPVLHVDSEWWAICALALVIAGGPLDREAFRSSIEWGFLILFGVLLGTAGVLRSAGVDRWIGNVLVPVAHLAGNGGVLVVLLGAMVIALRLVLPWIPATLLLSLALVPAAPRLGLSPWVMGFVVLMAANTWVHPRQSDYCRLIREATAGETFTNSHGVVMGVAMTLLTLIGIAVSVPYWQAIGVLRP